MSMEIDQVTTVWYTYDAFNRLISRVKDGTATTRYYYDDLWRLVAEYDGNDNLVAKYVYGPRIDEPVRMARSGTNYYYHSVALGTVTEVTLDDQTVAERYTYDVYGEPKIYDSAFSLQTSSLIGNRLLFQGRDRDPDTGLYNYRNRYYSPSQGRFVQVDPIRHRGGLNLYASFYNGPANKHDVFGLDACGDQLSDCLNKAKENRDWNVCELGKAYNNQKKATQTAKDFWNEVICDRLGSPTSPGVIGCKAVIDEYLGIYSKAVTIAYGPLLAGIYTVYAAEVGTCYTSYLYCQVNKVGIF